MPLGKVSRYNARPMLHRPLYLRQELPESRPGRSCPCATLDSSLRGAVRGDFAAKRNFEQVKAGTGYGGRPFAADGRVNDPRRYQIALFWGFRRGPTDSLTNQAIRCFHRSREFYINVNNRLSQSVGVSKEEAS